MTRNLHLPLFPILLLALASPFIWADDLATSSTDPFDSTQGTTIINHDTIVDPINAFRTSGGFENGHTLMRNGGLNSVSFIEFQTGASVTLGAVRLTAGNDYPTIRRALNRFRLLADTDSNGSFETEVINQTFTPNYISVPCNVQSGKHLDIALPASPIVTATRWRLEVTQGSNIQPFEGARVIEVDAITSSAFYDLATSITGPSSVAAGSTAVYSVSVTNNGPGTASGVVVSYPTPAGLSFVSNTGACAGAYPCNIGSLTSGQTKVITTTWMVPSNYGGASFSNNPSVPTTSAEGPCGDNADSQLTSVTTSADVSISKSATSLVPGQNVVYTVTVTNNGPSDAQSVSVTDPTPAGLTFVSNTGACTTAYPCALGTMSSSAVAVITSTYSVPDNYTTPDPVANTATVSSSTSDPNGANDSASLNLAVSPEADLSITKTGDLIGKPGEEVQYTITVTNNGPSVASTVTVSDPNQTGFSNTANSGDCAKKFPCTLLNMTVGESRVITSTFGVAPNFISSSVDNTATVSFPAGTDPDSSNNSDTVKTDLISESDVELLVAAPQFAGGDSLTYSMTINNYGPSEAGPVILDIPTPQGVSFVDATASCTNGFPCQINSIAAGASLGVTAQFEISGTTANPLVMTITANVATDPDPSNNTAIISTDTCPSPITDMLPPDGSIDVLQSSSLMWTAINADEYEVYLGPVGSGCSTLVGTTTTSSYAYKGLARRTSYEWMVIAKKAGCPTGDVVSACQTFDSGPPCPVEGPVALFPPDGGLDYLSPIKFEWTAVYGAVSYNVWASIDDTPAVVIGTSESTSLVYEASPGSFEWWVEAIFDDCPKVGSPVVGFTASGSCVTRAAVLTSPEDGAELSSPVHFDWEPVGGAQAYSVWVSVDGKFPIVVASTTTETEATVSVPSGSLRWYVQSRYERCPPAISEIRTIEVPPRPECAANEAVTVTEPFSGQRLLSPIEFSWTPVDEATGYTVWASIDGDTPSIVATTDGATRVEQELRPGAVVWFVQANFDQCPSTESVQDTFIVLEPGSCEFDTPQPLNPPASTVATTSVVEFSWLEAAGSVEYRVWASIDGGRDQLLASTPSTKTSIEVPVPIGTIDWYVEALFLGCPSKSSTRSTFSVPASTACQETPPNLFSPRSGAEIKEENDVELIWDAVPGAIEYRVWLVPDNGTKTLVASTTRTTYTITVDPGRYEWYVEVIQNGCPSIFSQRPNFTIIFNPACENRRPIPLAPVDGSANLTSPVTFVWTPVQNASGYRLWIEVENAPVQVLDATADQTELTVPVPASVVNWWVDAITPSCSRARSTKSELRVIDLTTCSLPRAPAASVVGEVTEGETFKLLWVREPGSTIYEVQQTTRFDSLLGIPDFEGSTVIPTTNFLDFTAPMIPDGMSSLTLYYRVRGIADCNQQRGPYSIPVSVVVTTGDQSGQIGSLDLIGRDLTLCADENGQVYECSSTTSAKRSGSAVSVNLEPTEPWLTVEPSTGTIPTGGSLTVRINADPSQLPTGTSTSALDVSTAGAKSTSGNSGSVPVSVGLAAPVTPNPRTTPPPYSQIIPAVIRADSATGSWQSDIRILNTTARRQKYQLNFTPSDVDGTQNGKQTIVEIGAGQVLAFDDIVRSWYGAANTNLTGVLEVRPMSSPSDPSGTGDGSTITSSRTYNSTPFGSFGQYIPGVPFGNFIGKTSGFGSNLLLLQQIAQSPRFRTNFGFVEASGQPVEFLVRIFDAGGMQLGEKSIQLQAGQHTQLNAMLAQMGIAADDARAEITVTSEGGQITAYASVVDSMTSDPTFIPAANGDGVTAIRRVLPGIADLDTAQNRWRSDVRIFNSAEEDFEATITFYPQSSPENPISKTVTLIAKGVSVLDDILRSELNLTNVGGALHVETAADASLIVTARTYDQRTDGTVGQFIPALTLADAASLGGRTLHVLQVEESDRLRTNLGLTEISGSPVEVEVAAVVPGALSAPIVRLNLASFEFRQIGSIFRQLGFEQVFNGRLLIRVTGGEGRVVAYASSVDNETGDPAYIPAQ